MGEGVFHYRFKIYKRLKSLKPKINKVKTKKNMKEFGIIALGSLLAALSIDIFLLPNKIAPGGVSGIATVIYYLSGTVIPVGTTMLCLNLPLFIIAFRVLGFKFVLKSAFGSIALSLFIDFLHPYTQWIVDNYLFIPQDGVLNPNLILYSVSGGFLMGVGLGLVVSTGATTGGSDLTSMILRKYTSRFSIGQILLFIDTIVISAAGVAFNSIIFSLYGLVSLYVSIRIIDAITEGVNFAKAAFIISDHSQIISIRLMSETMRGVTCLKGSGGYSGADKNVLLCVVHRNQIGLLKTIVREEDPAAFIIFTDAREVFGEGFIE